MKITLLGTGSSVGVPQIGCTCAVCRSNNPKNKRSRVSVLVETRGKKLLIDTSPDLRMQALSNNINSIDAILYTHDHADHIHGIDDIRMFNIMANGALPAYATAEVLEQLKKRFPYIFQPPPKELWYRPALSEVVIKNNPLDQFNIFDIPIMPVLQLHAQHTSLGFRIDNFAYCTDVNGFPEKSFDQLQGLDVWVIDCLRYKPSYTHSRVELTLEWIARLKPKRAILTHMAHDLEYETLARELPPGVEPGFDGMVIELPEPV